MFKKAENLLAEYEESMRRHRRWLHEHPELSGEEKESAAYIAAALRDMGLTPTEGVGGYGVTALIEGAKPGRCIALRADFDALPIEECTGLPFSSRNPGVCHACGHDMHAAMLLGAAYVLHSCREDFAGSVKLIFQPAEENVSISGARRMIADGVLENPHVDAIIGQHVDAALPVGTTQLRKGPVSAGSDRFFITVHGKSCHAARPHTGVDAIVLAAHVVTTLQTIVSRNINPLKSAVISIGKINGGTGYNVISDSCQIEGTCRNLDPAIRAAMPGQMESIIRGITEGMGGSYSFEYHLGYSPVVNDEQLTELVLDTARQIPSIHQIIIPDTAGMGGEDFAFYEEYVPGVFYRTGTLKDGAPYHPAHSGYFSPDEDAMRNGASVMALSALRYLNQNP